MKHTPAPWVASQYIDDGRWGVLSSDNGIIVSVRSKEGSLTKEDARLIAAAPDLLEALQEAVRLIEQEDLATLTYVPKFRAAIAKAAS